MTTKTTTTVTDNDPQLDRHTNVGLSNDSFNHDDDIVSTMFITANVGTIFEDSEILELWVKKLKQDLLNIKPQFVALHCQEIGGKNYEKSMEHVSIFINKLLDDEDLRMYDRMVIFLDEDFKCSEKFTALGSLYFIHGSLKNIKLWNFQKNEFETIQGRQVFSGNIEDINLIEKVKFPQTFFPESRWSRKGFMRSRWLIKSQKLDLVNIHLFHDASNFIAMEANPSPYAQTRQRALEFTLNRISMPLEDCKSNNNHILIKQKQQSHKSINKSDQNEDYEPATKKFNLHSSIDQNDMSKTPIQVEQNSAEDDETPLFIFGDFNFRLDTSRVIERITEGNPPSLKMSAKNNEVEEMIYKKGSTDDIIMTIGKKTFDCDNLDETFHGPNNTNWLLELDNELDRFREQLHEFQISFSPSYPFREDSLGGYSYMKTRCPAWCDRILFNKLARTLVCNANQNDTKSKTSTLNGEPVYTLMGDSVPMGDHKAPSGPINPMRVIAKEQISAYVSKDFLE